MVLSGVRSQWTIALAGGPAGPREDQDLLRVQFAVGAGDCRRPDEVAFG